MKKTLLILATFIALNISAQPGKTLKVPKTGGRFYKTYTDFINKKPIDSVYITDIVHLGWSIQIKKGNNTEKIKEGKIPYEWFCDFFGNLVRVYDGKTYYVMTDGPVCHYIGCREVTIIPTQTEDLIFSRKPDEVYREYYSEKIDGEILPFKEKMFDDYLEKTGLAERFKEEKLEREMKNSVLDYKNKEWNKRYKYKLLINEKLKT